MRNHNHLARLGAAAFALLLYWPPAPVCGQDAGEGQAPKTISADSALKAYSSEEFLQFKNFYDKERRRLETTRAELRGHAIADMESFLKAHPESRVSDKVMVRLAELYQEKAREDFYSAQEAYGRALSAPDSGGVSSITAEPRLDYSRSLALYQRLLDDYPQSGMVDDALFNQAFLTEEIGQRQTAAALYESLPERFPQSRYVPDALMRLGEYYFHPTVHDIQRAIATYRKLLQHTGSPKYDEALYRLGWCYYKLSQYPQAIACFTLLADDVERAARFDPKHEITNPSLKDESVEYIGISFLDFQGAEGAERYLTNIGGRAYGVDILLKIGDAYMNVKEEYERAIQAYNILLRLYPHTEQAPLIQAKIAGAYDMLGNERSAYTERDVLFERYGSGSEWWKRNQNVTAREQATQLGERALRDNISLALRQADEGRDGSLYAQVVADSRKYLSAFARDSAAARIHWNLAVALDTKLHESATAYEEYLAISTRYQSSQFPKMAAENAIVLAQEAARADTAEREPAASPDLAEVAAAGDTLQTPLKLQPQALSPGETKLVQALDSYIRLFPQQPETAERLAQAGALYYNRRHFGEALKYFKTLIKNFPESPEIGYAQYLVMESYFGKGDYRSAEIVAQRVRGAGGNEEWARKAKERLAESIFFHAEGLADSAEHHKAAEEFCRVVRETPDAEFADLALYNAGLQYDLAREFKSAVETYTQLTSQYRLSRRYLSALNNLALDLGELKQHADAAVTFERLSTEEPDSAKTEGHMFNACVFASRAGDWQLAIRLNQQFVARFPHAADADDLFYEVANCYLKLQDLDKANAIYAEYADKFPDTPRAVEACYRRGEFFEGRGELTTAKNEYEKAIAKSTALRAKKLEASDFFAGEALYRLAELKFREFAAVRFTLPADLMGQAKARKKGLLLDLVDSYTRVAALGTTRLYEASYKIGLAYEEFAETWAQQEIPAVDDARRIVAQKEINQTAAELYERAVEAYKEGLQALMRLSARYQKSLGDSGAIAASGRVAAEDTTMLVAQQWIERTREKISETIYEIAEINTASLERILQAPMPAGIDHLSALEFRNQLLGRVAKPLVIGIVEAHQRNLREAAAMGLDNSWVEQSRERLVAAGNTLAEQYAGLAWQAFAAYDSALPRYTKALASDRSAAVEIQDEMANGIDFACAFSKAAVQSCGETIERAAAANINAAGLAGSEEKLLTFATRVAGRIDSLAAQANAERLAAETKLKQAAGDEFADAVFAYEDNYFALKDGVKEILQMAFEISQRQKIAHALTGKIALQLVRLEPEKYAGLLNLRIATLQVVSDQQWQASSQPAEGWTEAGSSVESWAAAVVRGESMAFKGYGAQRISLAETPAATGDLPGAGHDSSRAKESNDRRACFRRAFEMAGLPVAGQVQLVCSGSYKLFVNGELIAHAELQGTSGNSVNIHDFSVFLRSGRNVMGLEVLAPPAAGLQLEAVIFLKSLPGWQERYGELRGRRGQIDEPPIFR